MDAMGVPSRPTFWVSIPFKAVPFLQECPPLSECCPAHGLCIPPIHMFVYAHTHTHTHTHTSDYKQWVCALWPLWYNSEPPWAQAEVIFQLTAHPHSALSPAPSCFPPSLPLYPSFSESPHMCPCLELQFHGTQSEALEWFSYGMPLP